MTVDITKNIEIINNTKSEIIALASGPIKEPSEWTQLSQNVSIALLKVANAMGQIEAALVKLSSQ